MSEIFEEGCNSGCRIRLVVCNYNTDVSIGVLTFGIDDDEYGSGFNSCDLDNQALIELQKVIALHLKSQGIASAELLLVTEEG